MKRYSFVPDLNAAISRRRFVLCAAVGTLAWGCAHDAALPPIDLPVALHPLPGSGMGLANVHTLYLSVFTQEVRYKAMLPQLTEIVASELRTALPVNVILVLDRGYDCPPCETWTETCDTFRVPVASCDPGAAVAICELQEMDPYPPIRMGMSLRILKVEDGTPLAGTQGVWEGRTATPPIVQTGFRWPWQKKIDVPPIDWNTQVEMGSTIDVMRRGARNSVQSLISGISSGEPMMPPATSPAELEPFHPPELPAAAPEDVETIITESGL